MAAASIAVLASCAPLPVTYYMPVAEDMTIRRYSCDQAPPYAGLITTVDYRARVYFDGRKLEIFLMLPFQSKVEFDSRSIRLEAAGTIGEVRDLQFMAPPNEETKLVPPGSFAISTKELLLFGTSQIAEPVELKVHLPALRVDGKVIPVRTVTFHRERRTKLRFAVVNC